MTQSNEQDTALRADEASASQDEWFKPLAQQDPVRYHQLIKDTVSTYRQLLAIPFGSSARFHTDSGRAFLRDLIADLTRSTPEHVQNTYEGMAYFDMLEDAKK